MTLVETKKIHTLIKEAQDALDRAAKAAGEQARKLILPYFREHKLTYVAGNGTWFVTRQHHHVQDDELPKEILELLMLEVGRDDHLGYYIRDIKRADWRVP